MKNILKQVGLVIVSFMLLQGCEDVATNVKMPPAEKKIVVQCFISPDDDTIKALVSWSKPVIGTSVAGGIEYIPNAKVEISDGVKTGLLLWNLDDNLYETAFGTFKIEAGKKYYLTVTLQDGKNVKANCTVPSSQNKTLVFTKADTVHYDWGTETNCIFKYSDHEPSVKNYFRLAGREEESMNAYYDYWVTGEFKQDSEMKPENNFEFLFYNDPQTSTQKIKAWLINCDYNYFQYHKTLQGAQNNPGFFSEPNIVFSNIGGGLGCFGAYYSYEVEVDF